MPHPVTPSMLSVPGASIHYEVRGSGPVLIVIPGGPQDAGVFADLARHLADRYTVVTYDPRGNSRSVLEGAPGDQRVDVHADDAALLIDALGAGPANVFGTSGGAQIGLDLVARYPDRVRAVVAHEPPCTMMLDDPTQALAGDQDVYDTYRREGVDAAMRKFFADNGLDDEPGADDAPPSPEDLETFGRVSGNFEYFLAHGLIPLSRYVPDVEILRDHPRITVGLGEKSAAETIYDIGAALAKQLGNDPVYFPGDHFGFGPQAESFAETLHRVLSRSAGSLAHSR
ncbi:alpha/beta fold hydrolase [Phytoactinopolyspora endophytica]|uniref:alpha/beta fold hydrolase n=1 Tax=Phytoactinopolyspora endophytica TaxID=1642495 RepID=UPI00101C4FB8|nr:alpha/beta hydrolase [Phytoactinopolyspora endophytica]